MNRPLEIGSGRKAAVVMTSIAAPNDVMRKISEDCIRLGYKFYVIGDTKSPSVFELDGATFLSIEDQLALGYRFANACPTRHYARKNIGYLLAVRDGVDYIAETDDDNIPSAAFYEPLDPRLSVSTLKDTGWINLYRYYTDKLIWPRGLPLDCVNDALPPLPEPVAGYAPIQQGLANENPDVDAIYRLILPLPFDFDGQHRIALGENAWCPFNSQNTIYFRDAFPLLYLPSHCSFRMTDIWRSFVAQRISWANGWTVLFREATVVQDRNDHSLMRDFEDEISGYLGNRKIARLLQDLPLAGTKSNMPDDMRLCYSTLTDAGFIGKEEMPLLDAWLDDYSSLVSK